MAEVNRELLRIVEKQGRQPVGIPVLLFTDATLAPDGPLTDGDEPLPDGGERTGNVVRRAAADLGFDLDQLELFSTESYLVQTVAGQLTAGA
ncbi:hypothetical protein GCM10022204_44260 [Microlunatus aurantiacus]|uniref:Uncharacterized protein n=1 Tax=Microlunatus aurantiacus TaxID=446786 RepID=A0ABP7EMW9_9ACTN